MKKSSPNYVQSCNNFEVLLSACVDLIDEEIVPDVELVLVDEVLHHKNFQSHSLDLKIFEAERSIF